VPSALAFGGAVCPYLLLFGFFISESFQPYVEGIFTGFVWIFAV